MNTYLVKDERLTVKEASIKYGIHENTLKSRMYKNNIELEEALFTYKSKKPRIKCGDKFGNLTVTEIEKSKNGGNAYYKVLCDCGNVESILGIVLKDGKRQSCNQAGCEYSSRTHHGLSGLREYKLWVGIKDRCLNPKNKSYPYYGGIGISISDEFKNSFVEFYNHIGSAPNECMSVDRIEVSKGYERGNIRWATRKEQSLNKRKVNELTIEINRLRKILHENGIKY